MRVRTQQCPCFITAGCTAAKFPILFFAAMEQGKNSHVLLAKRKSWHEQSLLTSLQIRNGSCKNSLISSSLQILNITKRSTRARCLLHLVGMTPPFLEIGVRSSLVKECVKSKVNNYCLWNTNTGSSTSCDPAGGMISFWTEFFSISDNRSKLGFVTWDL